MYKMSTFYFFLTASLNQTGIKSMEEMLTYINSIGITELDMSPAEINDDTPALLKRTGMSVASVHGGMPCEFSTEEKYTASSLAVDF